MNSCPLIRNPRTNPRGGDRRGLPRQFSGRPGCRGHAPSAAPAASAWPRCIAFRAGRQSRSRYASSRCVKNDAVSEVVVGEQNVRGTLKQAGAERQPADQGVHGHLAWKIRS